MKEFFIMIKAVNSLSFNGRNVLRPLSENSLKAKTETYYKNMFSEIEKGFDLGKKSQEFYNPITNKFTAIYPVSCSKLVSIRPLGGSDELRLSRINTTKGILKETGILDSSEYSINHQNYKCELWHPFSGFFDVNKR